MLDGPHSTCTVCNRWLYKRSAIDYKEENYNIFLRRIVYKY